MRRVLITGGAGFLGGHLTAALLQRGIAVRILDSFVASSRDTVLPQVEVVADDIRDPRAVSRAASGVDRIVHLAAVGSVEQSEQDPALTESVNIAGTETVLAMAIPVIYASSAAVYGMKPAGCQSESDEPAPLSLYGQSKHANECHAAFCWRTHGLASVGLRIFNAYGRLGGGGVVAQFCQRIQDGGAIVIQGSGAQSRDFVHVDDVVRAMLLALNHPAGAAVYNVCTGIETSIRRLAAMITEISGADPGLESKPGRAIDVPRSVGCPDHAAAALGFRATVALQDGLAAMLRVSSKRS